ncbi:MAG: glycosyltransferase family 9 protein [Planctomycetota bacterium]
MGTREPHPICHATAADERRTPSQKLSPSQPPVAITAEDHPRILISRMSAVGDTILTLPVACALREHFPNAYLGWVVESKAATMVREHDALDTVIELPRKWFLSRRGVKQARETLREHDFEITLDCQGNTKSSLACFLSGAKRRIGYQGAHALELSPLFNNERVPPALTHLTDRSLELLSPLGIHCPAVHWRVPIDPSERQWARQYRAQFDEKRIVILNPGGTWPSKLWEADRFASTARYLSDRYGYRAWVVWGTFEERLMAEQIVEASAGTATLTPDTSLMSLAALIESADLFISGDTGPLHMSVAVDTATIGLYGATRPGDCGPYGHTALQNAYESGSRRHRRRADNRAMRSIGVEHVCQAVDDLHRHLVDVSQVKAA